MSIKTHYITTREARHVARIARDFGYRLTAKTATGYVSNIAGNDIKLQRVIRYALWRSRFERRTCFGWGNPLLTRADHDRNLANFEYAHNLEARNG